MPPRNISKGSLLRSLPGHFPNVPRHGWLPSGRNESHIPYHRRPLLSRWFPVWWDMRWFPGGFLEEIDLDGDRGYQMSPKIVRWDTNLKPTRSDLWTKNHIPGNSAIVTFLGWWKRDPFEGESCSKQSKVRLLRYEEIHNGSKQSMVLSIQTINTRWFNTWPFYPQTLEVPNNLWVRVTF